MGDATADDMEAMARTLDSLPRTPDSPFETDGVRQAINAASAAHGGEAPYVIVPAGLAFQAAQILNSGTPFAWIDRENDVAYYVTLEEAAAYLAEHPPLARLIVNRYWEMPRSRRNEPRPYRWAVATDLDDPATWTVYEGTVE